MFNWTLSYRDDSNFHRRHSNTDKWIKITEKDTKKKDENSIPTIYSPHDFNSKLNEWINFKDR